MEHLSELLKSISWDKGLDEQLDKLKFFDNLNDEQISELTSSKYIKDEEAGIVLRYLGYEKLKNKVPEQLQFLQDMNWPAAHHVSILLTRNRPRL
jgi:hypothetical protein